MLQSLDAFKGQRFFSVMLSEENSADHIKFECWAENAYAATKKVERFYPDCLVHEITDETILGDWISDYNWIEVAGCRLAGYGAGVSDSSVEIIRINGEPKIVKRVNDDPSAEFFSVYLNAKSGGVDFLLDFKTKDEAMAYAEVISDRYGLPVELCV